MAGLGRKDFEAGQVLSAADVNGYLMDQSVQRFADASARDTAIPTPTEGMVCYLDDVNQIELYNGTDWVDQQSPLLSEGTAGQYLQSNGASGSQWVTSPSPDDLITTQGDLIIGDASGDAVRLPVGAADTVLTSDGTTLSFAAAAGGGGTVVYAFGTHTVSFPEGHYLFSSSSVKATVDGVVISETELRYTPGFTSLDIAGAGNYWNPVIEAAESINNINYFSETGTYTAVGNNGLFLSSTDGINWTTRNVPTTDGLRDVVYAYDKYITGAINTVYISSDLINWTSHTIGLTTNLAGLAYGDVTYQDGIIVAIGSTQQQTRVSSDGITWTSVTSGSTSNTYRVDFVNNLFIITSNGIISSSSDGLTWNPTGGFTSMQGGAAFGNGIYFVPGNNRYAESTDGVNWTYPSNTIGGTALATVFDTNANLFYIGYQTGTPIGVTTDGSEFTTYQPGGIGHGRSLAFDGSDVFVSDSNQSIFVDKLEGANLAISQLPTPIQP